MRFLNESFIINQGTIISGFVLAIVLVMVLADGTIPLEAEAYQMVTLSFWCNMDWSLYYFNFVQVPAMAKATADKEPGPLQLENM